MAQDNTPAMDRALDACGDAVMAWQASLITGDSATGMWRTIRAARDAVAVGVSQGQIAKRWADRGCALSSISKAVIAPMVIVADWEDAFPEAVALLASRGLKVDPTTPWRVVTKGQKVITLDEIRKMSDSLPQAKGKRRVTALADLIAELLLTKKAEPQADTDDSDSDSDSDDSDTPDTAPAVNIDAKFAEFAALCLKAAQAGNLPSGEAFGAVQAGLKAIAQAAALAKTA